MRNICILLLSFAFTQIVCAQSYNDSTSTGNVEVSKRKGTEHIIGLDIRPSYLFPTHEFFKENNNAGKKITIVLPDMLNMALSSLRILNWAGCTLMPYKVLALVIIRFSILKR